MKCWQASQLRVADAASGAEGTFAAILSEVRRLGFQYCSFAMKAPVPVVSPPVLWCSNYPDAWQKRYEEQAYVRRDPTVIHAVMSDEPLLWSDELFADCEEIRVEARSFGLVYGWAQPRRDAHGMVSLLSCVRSEPAISYEEMKDKIERVQWLSYRCHEGMLKHWGLALRGNFETRLTGRELEVLRWSCDGKTSADMAQIIGVSEATVNFHMRNACLKLGTGSKTAAAVRAALLGLLW
jgi:LuxR family transcriptional regulator, quorum-sensing system regulator SolR